MSDDKLFADWQIKFRERTEKLFLLLSSDHDGEVAAAARALLRHLDGVEIDMHGPPKVLAAAAGNARHTHLAPN